MLVETRVGRLFVERRGEGAPLVLWPSLLTEGSMWRAVAPALSERFTTLTIDPPGHGRSGPVRRAFSLEDCADAAREVLDALSIERASWAGLSFGGMTGMRFALRHPGRLDRLALLDTSADREPRRKLPSYAVMSAVARRIGAIGPLVDRIEPLFFTKETRQRRRDLVEPFREQLVRMDPESIGHAVDAVIFRRADIRPQLGSIRAPTLVLVGDEDVATPPSCALDIADRIAGSRLIEIGGAAHLSPLERPRAVGRALLEHLDP